MTFRVLASPNGLTVGVSQLPPAVSRSSTLAAVALAGNVLQFFETATKFTVSTGRICRSQSAGETTSDLKELRGIVADFQGLLVKLQPQGTALNHEHRGDLSSLSRNCADTAQELMTKLDKIGLGREARGDLLLAEFRAMWKGRAIQELESRIMRFRDQLAFYLVVMIRDLSTQSLARQDVILAELRLIRGRIGDAQPSGSPLGGTVPVPGSLFIHTLSRYLGGSEHHDEEQLSLLRAAMHANIPASSKGEKKLIHLTLTDDVRSRLQKELISSFHYEEREHRESNIKSPYDETFKWIFPQAPLYRQTALSRWLQSDDPLFWVTGKAGSGKSTLMKYISGPQHNKEGETLCHPYLGKWAGKSRLVCASVFFWASGTAMESSQDALFRSLLHQIFQQSMDLIPVVTPSHWESLCLLGPPLSTEWQSEDLRAILLRTIREVGTTGDKICLFIDGLDEFDGDLSSLISTIHQVSKLSNVKVCVSSRPWEEFAQAFSGMASLRVQDLTRDDIQHYVKHHFGQNDGFKRLQAREPDFARTLLEEIVEKSAAGLSNDDRVCDLKRRLDDLPPELEKVYARILQNLDPFYYEHACQYFKLVMACDKPPPALLISFADEDWDHALELSNQPLRFAERASRIETLRRRLNSRCKGFLEIGADDRVNFLHRTAREYVASAEAADQIEEGVAKSTFDPYMQLFLALATRFGLVDYLDARTPPGACCEFWTRPGSRKSRFFSQKLRTHTVIGKMQTIISDRLTSRRHSTPAVDSEAGSWPLILAACFGTSPNIDVFRILLERGANYDAPWDFGDAEFVAIFSAGDTKISLRFGNEESILPVIIWARWTEVLQLLKSHGATFNVGLLTKVRSQNPSLFDISSFDIKRERNRFLEALFDDFDPKDWD
ncbi:hypothetical protein QBC34DRAFT_496466 [Podospora aff. communis PSN243]|uniref:NACHT domain-containing protein n=1 Tax=Podospora aff. communis PSN243 TaxID=3040156 RepID=A0AAV9GG73_9PEZI|nr:hypothetical protein QBC34DRAFT_496466 [Podospora aff. communis PSN243]